MREEKVRAQADRRNMLDYSLKLKMKKKVFLFHDMQKIVDHMTHRRKKFKRS